MPMAPMASSLSASWTIIPSMVFWEESATPPLKDIVLIIVIILYIISWEIFKEWRNLSVTVVSVSVPSENFQSSISCNKAVISIINKSPPSFSAINLAVLCTL